MNNYNVKDLKIMITPGKMAVYVRYRRGEMIYRTETEGFEFVVPISDTGDGVFLARDRAIGFMRYIRKALKALHEQEAEVVLH